jgi:hypothetical protein
VPQNRLPRINAIVRITHVDVLESPMQFLVGARSQAATAARFASRTTSYLVHSRLGAGRARALAIRPENASMKLVPWVAIAARLSVKTTTSQISLAVPAAAEASIPPTGAPSAQGEASTLLLCLFVQQAIIEVGASLVDGSEEPGSSLPRTSDNGSSKVDGSGSSEPSLAVVHESQALSLGLEEGKAFCFLPLPFAAGGFSIHMNGYFELSSNRRDIWGNA